MLRIALFIDRISTLVGSTAAMLVLPLGLIMTYEALARFILNWPTFWAYELSYMLTGAHFALGIALVTRNNAHIRIDFLYSRMPARVKYFLDFTILLFFNVFSECSAITNFCSKSMMGRIGLGKEHMG